ncbi:hypothetical protein BDB00DRAFT_868381 [Zychaea mexicana]|uniref:uncharacterized protein n=1 Tax=Zychaea mexicana TaxID=64656 RepID=UPI0022FE7EF3|nr:uncharacterized protein BDB00DRAFT_868381 [Zychaea mexicana]KAI9497337.1 hypothetical protein BDB00DRAFT_868381 [Zychaea mexicana]
MTAPPVPEKSRLRKQSTVSIDTTATTATTANNTAGNSANVEQQQLSKSRYTEQFDLIPPPELLEALSSSTVDNDSKRSNKPSTTHKTLRPFLYSSNSTTTIEQVQPSPNNSTSRPPISNATFWSSSSISHSFSARNLSSYKLSDLSEPEDNSSVKNKPATTPNKKQAKKSKSKLFGSSVSLSKSTPTTSHEQTNKSTNNEEEEYVKTSGPRVPTIFSLNRADVIISRLDYWQHLLKAVINWMEELVKISFQNSRCYSQRALPVLKEDIGDTSDDEKNAMATVQAGLQMLSIQLANEEKEFGKRIQQDFLPGLIKLRKDAKEMIRGLKEEPELVMDELLRYAETTRKSMTQLNRHCKAAETYPVEHDPWLANLYVLRQLKHEVDEENRMRKLMMPIQKGTAAYEARALEQLKPAIEFCYKKLAPGLWEGSEENDTPFRLVMEHIAPSTEWKSFYESKKKDLVNEENPLKDYLKINYPNKLNPKVMTVAKGIMERRTGVLKQYTERYFVLSQCGYLHQFTMGDKVSPERSIYIPECTVVPSIDISHFAENDKTDGPYTFEIHKRGTQVLQRDRVFYFRTNSREELLSWCRVLCDVSSVAQGTRMIPHPITNTSSATRPSDSVSSSASSSVEGQHNKKNSSTVSVPTIRSVRSNMTATPPAASQPNNTAATASMTTTSSTRVLVTSTTTDTKTTMEADEKTETSASEAATPASSSSNGINGTNGHRHISFPSATSAAVDDDEDDAASIKTARATADEPEQEQSKKDEEQKKKKPQEKNPHNEAHETEKEEKNEEQHQQPTFVRPESRASTVDDSESSVYFSSTSGPPSPTSTTSSIPDHHFEFPALQDDDDSNNYNSNRIDRQLENDGEEDEPSTPRAQFYQPMLNFSI